MFFSSFIYVISSLSFSEISSLLSDVKFSAGEAASACCGTSVLDPGSSSESIFLTASEASVLLARVAVASSLSLFRSVAGNAAFSSAAGSTYLTTSFTTSRWIIKALFSPSFTSFFSAASLSIL